MYSIGTFGFASLNIEWFFRVPQHIGIAAMFVGVMLGFFGLKKTKQITIIYQIAQSFISTIGFHVLRRFRFHLSMIQRFD